MRKLTLTLTACLAALPAVATAQTTTDPATTPPAAPVEGAVIFQGNWDGAPVAKTGGLPANWLGIQTKPAGKKKACFAVNCAGHTFKLVTDPFRDGTTAARFEVRDRDNPFGSDERVEVQGPTLGKQGANQWYSFSIYLPADFAARGANSLRGKDMLLTKWAVEKAYPPVGIAVDRDTLTLQIHDQKAPGKLVDTLSPFGVPLANVRGRWVDFAMFVRWSKNGDGQIQLWMDGVQQPMNWPFAENASKAPAHGGSGSYAYTGRTLVPKGQAAYIKQGIFRSKSLSGRTVVVLDGMVARRATVIPAAPPAVAPPAA